jgi:hypothetical protein
MRVYDKFFNSQALNKLLILFVIKKSNRQFTSLELAGMFMDNRLMNYFIFQNCITELIDDGLIEIVTEADKSYFALSAKADELLPFIITSIPIGLQTLLVSILETAGKIKHDLSAVTADYFLEGMNNYAVECKFSGDGYDIMGLKISSASEKFAKEICRNWLKHTNEIYMEIMESLMKER